MSLLEDMQEPFAPDEIHWRVGTVAKNGERATLLAYIDARAAMDRLDEVVGPERWQDSYREGAQGGLICRIELLVPPLATPLGAALPTTPDRWVGKEDGAENTKVEAVPERATEAHQSRLWLESIAGDSEPLVPIEVPRHHVEVVRAIYKSAATHRPVGLPLDKSDPFYRFEGHVTAGEVPTSS